MSRPVFARMLVPIDVIVGCSMPPEKDEATMPYFVSRNGYSPNIEACVAMWLLIAESRATLSAAYSGRRYERIGIVRPSSAVYVSSTVT